MTKIIAKKIVFIAGFVFLSFFLSGCIIKFVKQTNYFGGMFKSYNKGGKWAQKVNILTVGVPRNLTNTDVISMAMDPQDSRAIYLGTLENGLFYSYDGGESWQMASSLPAQSINAIVIDPSYKCTIYVASANQIFQSNDCSRSWKSIYFDTRKDAMISALAVDTYNVNRVYAATSLGDLFKSDDLGKEWTAVFRILGTQISKIVVDYQDTRLLYLATSNMGIFKSKDSGVTWNNITEESLKAYPNSQNFRGLLQDKSATSTFFLISDYGIFTTINGGEKWQPLNLLTPPGKAIIYSFASNSHDGKEFYYATESTLYKTTDGGANWISSKLPTDGLGSYLLVDFDNPNNVYLGIRHREAKKSRFIGF